MENDNVKFKKYFWILLDILLAGIVVNLLFFVMPAIKRFGESLAPVRTITVSAEGKTFIVPDIARTSFSVVSEGVSPTTITTENNKKISAAIDFVKGKGIDSKDVQTSGYNLSPRYEYDKNKRTTFISGYTLTQTVDIKIRDFSKIAEIIGGLPSLGINQIGGLTFTVDDPEKFLTEARKEAFEKARAKASAIVSLSGARLGRVITVGESSGGFQPIYARSEAKFGLGGAADMAPLPSIEPGSQEVQLTVSITYALQ
ncbi:MAG: 26 kDa periplasmic immunogenic protein [Parcubacteria group bacterium GW2011_GWA1_50_14]|nr:MAG: 26 kDa periplasmic immunogenic protein [Parcubacteria group bacterium GW2011_GWA1_50_14]